MAFEMTDSMKDEAAAKAKAAADVRAAADAAKAKAAQLELESIAREDAVTGHASSMSDKLAMVRGNPPTTTEYHLIRAVAEHLVDLGAK